MKYFPLILFFIFIHTQFAQAIKLRKTSIEWDQIEGATFYEVAIKQTYSPNQTQFKKNEKTAQANLQLELPPGVYELKIRSYDQRKVAGEFSEPIQLIVQLENPKLTQLKKVIQSENQDFEKVSLSWKPVLHAERYQLKIKPTIGKMIEIELKQTEYSIELPVAQKYTWSVQAIAENKILNNEAPELQEFQINGAALDEPEIIAPENEFVRQLTWNKPNYSQYYQFEIQYEKDGKWTHIQKGETTSNKVSFNKNFPGGKYQFSLQAFADLRQASKIAKVEFDVIQGDRSKATESSANQKRSITTPDGIHVQARYSLSNLQYNNHFADQNQRTQLNATSGIAGIGIGVASKFSNTGYVASIDYGILGFNDQTIQFYSLEMNLTTHYELEQSKFKLLAGANIKQFPSIGSDQSGNLIPKNLSSYGFHIGIEYWYALTGKLGLQANIHLYELFGTIETPNKEPIQPSLSSQFGIMGAYRITPMTTGYIGYMRKNDQIKYEPSYDSISLTDNQIIMSGDYLSLNLESKFDETDFFVKKNINKKQSQGIYNIARYYISNINYVHSSTEVGTRTAFNAISGIGGVGIGYVFENSNWGLIGYFDYGGLGFDNQNVQFGSFDLNSTYDFDLSTSRFRISTGFALKQLPSITKNNNGSIDSKMISGFGLHLGAEYSYSINTEFGIQSHIHLYEILGKLSTPNGQRLTPSTSSQLGVMGSYQLSSQMKGLAGVTTRVDQMKFAASSNATVSAENNIHIQGQFLNLILEINY